MNRLSYFVLPNVHTPHTPYHPFFSTPLGSAKVTLVRSNNNDNNMRWNMKRHNTSVPTLEPGLPQPMASYLFRAKQTYDPGKNYLV